MRQRKPSRTMTVVSKDGVVYEIEEHIIRESQLLIDAHAAGKLRFKLKKIDGATLKNIIEYLTLYRNRPPYKPVEINTKPVRASKNDIGQKYLNNLDEKIVDRFLHATHYLQASRLIDGVCAFLLHHVDQKSIAEIRTMFCLPETSAGVA